MRSKKNRVINFDAERWCWHCGTSIVDFNERVRKVHFKTGRDVYFHKACMKPYRQQLFRSLVGY